MARTVARAATFTRTDLLILQVRAAVDRAMDMSPETFARIVAEGLRRRSIAAVELRALDGGGLCHASLELRIDWKANRLLVSQHGESLDAGARWREGVSPDVLALADLFGEYAEEQGLVVKASFALSPGVDERAEMSALGLVDGTPTRWAGGDVAGADIRLQHLTEMTAAVRFIEVR